MKCVSCQREIPDGVQFCPICGEFMPEEEKRNTVVNDEILQEKLYEVMYNSKLTKPEFKDKYMKHIYFSFTMVIAYSLITAIILTVLVIELINTITGGMYTNLFDTVFLIALSISICVFIFIFNKYNIPFPFGRIRSDDYAFFITNEDRAWAKIFEEIPLEAYLIVANFCILVEESSEYGYISDFMIGLIVIEFALCGYLRILTEDLYQRYIGGEELPKWFKTTEKF